MRIEVEVFKEVDGVDMVVCFFEVELLCGKRHRGLHGSHNSPTFHWVTCCKYSSFCLFCKAPGEELHLQWAFAGTSRLCVPPLNVLLHSRLNRQQALILPRE